MLRHKSGFTIVELIIVITVIGILAAITIVGYSGVQKSARESALKSDLSAAVRQMKYERAKNGGTMPSSFSSSIKVSNGNVLSLTAVTDSTKEVCINGYGPSNQLMSMGNKKPLGEYLCDGALVGTPLGGSVPAVPTSTNLVSDFSTWTITGTGVTYDSGSNEIRFSTSGSGAVTSPLIRVNGAATCRLEVETYATQPSPSSTPNTQSYNSSQYYGADGVTRVLNTSGHTGNGNAKEFGLNTWFNFTWNTGCGPNVMYVRFVLNSTPSSRTSDNIYRNPRILTL